LFELRWTDEANSVFHGLKKDKSQEKRYKAVKKTLKLLAKDPRHPGLKTHPYWSLKGPEGEKVFEAYAEQSTPSAFRVFWYYGPSRGVITIITITSHP